ncbi:GNAT family N-acetyltransferase [Pseudomonas syringae pv. theae]|uniref:GNAT family N-acetyltransferase n=1 Tax=Pseudomonas syringae TaxID=317 RepID=UPI001EEEBD71|nr:GNAT family N-acetyltransferase [Pseudomonas syringae]MBL3828454.1 GNAT family N-acetyltransferase [Pseudomonas syringae pv. theae]MBL3833822.1 GNAT family N-acetyltransferase [Pseudomonas syringae pv. theae]MBL3866225.1 GNAT family N-acetyltransferase [Pseudomonas syringae pv. theae]GKQ47504.1 GNAT family N-acetyltransferase [Pseudomonas syringae pv. theae]GKS05351.1 GNAT family N-acetyltransferase [Pseudomonas syringae pv. theae]
MSLIIRAMADDDWTLLAQIFQQPIFRWWTLRMPYQSSNDIKNLVENRPSSGLSLVAELDGLVVGCAMLYRFNGRRQHVADFWMGVADGYRRQGVGNLLLKELVTTASQWMNIKRLELTVFADNEAAIELYKKNGFLIEGLHKNYAYRQGEYVDAVSMSAIY